MVRVIFFVMMGSRQKLLNDVDGNREKMQAARWMLPWMLDLGCWLKDALRAAFLTKIRHPFVRHTSGEAAGGCGGWGHVVIVILSSGPPIGGRRGTGQRFRDQNFACGRP